LDCEFGVPLEVVDPPDDGKPYSARRRIYTFIGEFGRREMSHLAFLRSDLRSRISDPDFIFLNLGLTLLVYSKSWLKLSVNRREADNVALMRKYAEENPLMFFLPSGSGGVDFLNDLDHGVKVIMAPNRVGKTAEMVVDILLDVVPTDPSWPIFSKHWVKHRPWLGAMRTEEEIKFGFATTDWKVIKRVMWPEIRKWIPKYELGPYDPRKRDAKDPTSPGSPWFKLTCGTLGELFCYEQNQAPFESDALHRFGWDEQGQEEKFDGADERLRTKNGRHVFAQTPHKIEGRADTGANSFIHKILSGEVTKGHSSSVHRISIPEVPDWVLPAEAKAKAYIKWVREPTKKYNPKVLAEGRARFYGEPHITAGLFYDDWDEAVHLIDAFVVPDDWTRYRALDHGLNIHPTVCLWGAVSPEGDLYLYREYFEIGKTIGENCRNIIRFSGNTWQTTSKNTEQRAGLFYERIRETTTGERYLHTVMDVRSAHATDATTQMKIEEIYLRNGLRLYPASGATEVDSAPAVREFMKVDPEREHPYTRKMGCSRLFVFRGLEGFIRQIRGFVRDEFSSSKTARKYDAKEKPRQKEKDFMDALRYLCQIPPRYIKGRWAYKDKWSVDGEREKINRAVIIRPGHIRRKGRKRDPITGY